MDTGAEQARRNNQDTQNNAADFVLRSVRGPQSTMAPPEP